MDSEKIAHIFIGVAAFGFVIALWMAAVPLLQAAPGGHRARTLALRGEIPSPAAPPSGCVFRTRCPFAIDACAREIPALRPVGDGHFKACIRDDLPL